MLIRWGYLNDGGIQRKDSAFEQQREFRKQDRRKIGATILDCFAHIRADEQRINPQVPFHFGLHIISGTDRQRLADLHVLEIRSVLDQRSETLLRHRYIAGEEDALIRLNAADSIVGGRES